MVQATQYIVAFKTTHCYAQAMNYPTVAGYSESDYHHTCGHIHTENNKNEIQR